MANLRLHPLTVAVGLVLSGNTLAQDGARVLDAVTVWAKGEDALPAASGNLGADDVAARRSYVSDTATLLGDVPGVSFYGSGGVSSLPVVHGLNDDRIRVRVDGMEITSACGNHMNPPLSYIAPDNVGAATAIAGITPVSLGGDSIGGTILIDSKPPVFARAGEGSLVGGSLSGYYRSNGNAHGYSVSALAANAGLSVAYNGAAAQSGNYKSGDGSTVGSSQYKTQNDALSIAARGNDNLVALNLGKQHIPYQGYPNAWMDMVKNDAWFGNLRYEGLFGWGVLEAKVYYQHTQHVMDFLVDKAVMGSMPMNTDGKNLGYLIKGEIRLSGRDTLRIGNELARFTLSDVWPPVDTVFMGPNSFENINVGRRDRLGTFAEWEAKWSEQWATLIGARHDRVSMNTGDVRPYVLPGDANANADALASQAADIAAATAFNTRDHKRTDDNFDLTLLGRYTPDEKSTFEAGYARKTRSPNLYERYTWGRGGMAMSMNGWFGDGNGYVGDVDLKPEVAHTISATASWHDAGKKERLLSATPYYTYVKDYIDADRCLSEMQWWGGLGGCPLAGTVRQTTNSDFVFLKFANHDARIYGIDISGRTPLADGSFGKLAGRGVIGYVNGRNLDTGDRLYHMMPLNAKFALDHRLDDWSSSLEAQLVAAKHKVQQTRNELSSSGYGLVNLRTSYSWRKVRLDAGVENLFDRQYFLPLGGSYIGDANHSTWGHPVNGMGRSVYVGATVKL